MYTSIEDPHEATLIDPVVQRGEEVLPVAEALVARGLEVAQGLGVRLVGLLLQDLLPYLALLLDAAPRWGFRPTITKHLYRLDDAPFAALVASPERALPDGAEFRPLGDPRSAGARALMEEVAKDSLQEEQFARIGGPAEFLVEMEMLCRGMDVWHPEDWEALVVGGRPAGLVLPAFLFPRSAEVTNLHVGIVPAFRGRGLGLALEERGLRTMARRGATHYVGSCDVRNAPMTALFRRMGCRRTRTQHLFEWVGTA
jgi:RimJ/RimL family protein N-acetyltransferase